jgi:hypothetical protein
MKIILSYFSSSSAFNASHKELRQNAYLIAVLWKKISATKKPCEKKK